jgi:glycosyltransferase involved in cell wall biosynthesis
MARILRIINRLNLGGPTYNVAFLSKYLSPEFETILVAGIKDESEESSEFIVTQMGLSPLYIDEMKREINLKNDLIAYRKISEIINKFKPDIVHTHAAKAGTLGRLAAINNRVPIILHTFHGHVFHSYFNSTKTFIFKNIEKYLANKTTGIIAISEKQKQELCEEHNICKPSKSHVIPLGFDLNRFENIGDSIRVNFRKKYKISDETILIGIIGRIVPIKNHRLFIESIATLKSQDRNIKFTAMIIGDGDDKQKIIELARNSGLKVCADGNVTDNCDVIFTSWILEIENALAGLDIVALTSLNEGTPVSLIEAQAAGKPIVSTNVGGISNVVRPNETALLSPPGDEGLFTRNLSQLIDNQGLRNSLSIKGRQFVSSRFSYKRLVEDTCTLYRQLLENNRISKVNK